MPHRGLPEGTLYSIINASPVGMLLMNHHGEIIFTNEKASQIFGYPAKALHCLKLNDLIPERFRQHHNDYVDHFLKVPQSRSMGSGREVVGLHKNGHEIPLEVGLSPVQLGGESYVLVSALDVTDRIKLHEMILTNKQLLQDACHDSLTGLANRRQILNFIENIRPLAIRKKHRVTLMFVDLDGFKQINDQYGHYIGDRLLCCVANTLTRHVRKSDLVGRIGGDEFLIVMADAGTRAQIEKSISVLLDAIAAITHIENNPVQISACVGAVTLPLSEDVLMEDVISRADRLMYVAKKAGHGRYVTEDHVHVSD